MRAPLLAALLSFAACGGAEPVGSTYLVGLSKEAPTALDALEAARLDLVTLDLGFGVALCAISGVGNPAETCLGAPSSGPYWAFFVLGPDGKWEQAQEGVSSHRVRDQDVLGFVWTTFDSNFNPVDQPPVRTFAEITAAAGAGSVAAAAGIRVGIVVSNGPAAPDASVLLARSAE